MKSLNDLSLETNVVELVSTFLPKSLEQIDPRPPKIVFKETEQIPLLIPLPLLPFIVKDPLISIDTEVLWDESTNYQFELFKFYRSVDQEI